MRHAGCTRSHWWAKLRAGVSASETFIHSKEESVTRREGHAGTSEMIPHVLGTATRYTDPISVWGPRTSPLVGTFPPKTRQVATKDTARGTGEAEGLPQSPGNSGRRGVGGWILDQRLADCEIQAACEGANFVQDGAPGKLGQHIREFCGLL